MPRLPRQDPLSTQEAARYLGMSVANMHYHLYVARDLEADGVLGRSIFFYRPTLDAFKKRKRPAHRPRKP